MRNPQICNQMDSSCNYSHFAMTSFDFNDHKRQINNMKLDDILNYSQVEVLDGSPMLQKSAFIDEVYEIFTMIESSKLIICNIDRQIKNIKQSNSFHYRSRNFFEKIKLIDLLKLLIVNRKNIDTKFEDMVSKNSIFLKEVRNCLCELDAMSNFCSDLQINEVEITKQFRLSTEVVDCILNDCGFDLSEMGKFIYNKMSDFQNKMHLVENATQSRAAKARFNRNCEKILRVLHNEIFNTISIIEKILDRLLFGHLNGLIDADYFHIDPDVLKQFALNINEYQFQRIVNTKHLLLALEQKASEMVIEVSEFQLRFKPENVSVTSSEEKDFLSLKVRLLSPIPKLSRDESQSLTKQASFVSSTPGPVRNSRRSSILFNLSNSHHNINDMSFSSIDSGYLLTTDNDPSLMDSCEDFDIIPFSDDEYEKIEDEEQISIIDNSIYDEPINMNSVTEEVNGDSNIKPESKSIESIRDIDSSLEHNIDLIQYCNDKNICPINTECESLFLDYAHVGFSIVESSLITPIYMGATQFNVTESSSDRTAALVAHENNLLNFNTALQMTVLRARCNAFDDDGKLLEYLERFLGSCNQCCENGPSHQCKSSDNVDNQFNNSACSPFRCTAQKRCDQNTNNNADSKDDDSNDLNTASQDHPINNNDSSVRLDADLHVAFRNILTDLTPSCSGLNVDNNEATGVYVFNDKRYSVYRDVTVNVNDTSADVSNADFNDSVSRDTDDVSLTECRSRSTTGTSVGGDTMGPVDDVELLIKLSELHIRCEFESEKLNKSNMDKNKERIVSNFGHLATQLNSTSANNNYSFACQQQVDIIVTDSTFPNNLIKSVTNQQRDEVIHHSLNEESSIKVTDQDNNETQSVPSNCLTSVIPEDQSLNCFDRVSLTVKLITKLLNLTDYQMGFISNLVHNNSAKIKPLISKNKSFSIPFLQKRLNMIVKILSNLKFSIQNSYSVEFYDKSFIEIDSLIELSGNLLHQSSDIEEFVRINGIEFEKIDCYYVEDELPDNLLIKMDPNDFNTVISTSTRRLKVTIEALSKYPCYDYFMKLSAPINDQSMCFQPQPLDHDLPIGVHHLQLLNALLKLRRITAICALNIVDLHVLLTRMETDQVADSTKIEAEVKHLLLFWRAVDGECHRLLRCTSMVHHTLTNGRRSFINLVSLIATIHSIERTLPLSDQESLRINDDLNNLMNYKKRVNNWLEEVEMCISLINEKRMTCKRFEYYEEIHSYLDENLTTISKLAEKIRDGCQQTVTIINEVMTYCSNLSNISISDIGAVLTTDVVVDNHHISMFDASDHKVDESVFNAVIDLENMGQDHNHNMEELYGRGMNYCKVIHTNDPTVNMFDDTNGDISVYSNGISQVLYDTIVESATTNISDKISRIAACAATNALILFVEKCGLELSADKDTEQQMSDWTRSSDEEELLDEVSCDVVEDMTTWMTMSLARNILQFRSELDSKMFPVNTSKDVCCDFSVDQANVEELFLSESQEDIVSNICGELECLLIDNSLEELQKISAKSDNNVCTRSCPSKLQKKLFANIMEKSKNIVSYMVDRKSDLITAINIDISKMNTEDPEYEYLKVLDILPPNNIKAAPIKAINVSHVPQNVSEQSVELIDSKTIINKRSLKNISISNNDGVTKTPLKINSKISKLVAQFNKQSCGSEPEINKSKSPIIKQTVERLSLNILNNRTNLIMKDLAEGSMKECQLNCVSAQHNDLPDTDRYSLDLINLEKSIVPGVTLQNPVVPTYVEIGGSENLPHYCEATGNVKSISPVLIGPVDDHFEISIRIPNVVKVNENIFADISLETMDSSILSSKCSSEEIIISNSSKTNVHFSVPVLEKYSTPSQNRSHCGNNNSQESMLSESSITNSHPLLADQDDTDSVRPSSLDDGSIQRPILLQFDDHIQIEKRIFANSNEIEDKHGKIGRSSTQLQSIPEVSANCSAYLSITHRHSPSLELAIDSPKSIVSINSPQKCVSECSFLIASRRSFSLFYLLVLLLIILFIFPTDQLYRFFNGIRISQSFYPRIISNGLPF